LNDRDIDNLVSGAKVPVIPNPETLARIAESIARSIRPVRPLAAGWLLTARVFLICMAVTLVGAAALGFSGIAKMNVLERSLVFGALALLALSTASQLVNAMTPGSRRRMTSVAQFAVSGLSLAAILAMCFRNYQITHFWRAGLVCLAIGLLHAVPAGLLSWWVLRRGFAVEPASAGLAAGTVAGLAGVAMLEFHCPNFQAAHVLVWHIGVLLASAGLGMLCGSAQVRFERRR